MKFIKIVFIFVLISSVSKIIPNVCAEDTEVLSYSSASLTINAWGAFNEQQYELAIEFSEKCIHRYSDKAIRMQSELTDFPEGSSDDIHRYYALNDVTTAHYIKAESLFALDRIEEAVTVYQALLDYYTFGQCWDQRGWFWKPAVAAREKLNMIETGDFYDFGDYSSMTLIVGAWTALENKKFDVLMRYTNKCIELYAQEAQDMQNVLHKLPKGSNEYINSFWALNDVATAYFIQGEALRESAQIEAAVESYQRVIDQYSYAQCWDPRGWFWRVSDGARNRLNMLQSLSSPSF